MYTHHTHHSTPPQRFSVERTFWLRHLGICRQIFRLNSACIGTTVPQTFVRYVGARTARKRAKIQSTPISRLRANTKAKRVPKGWQSSNTSRAAPRCLPPCVLFGIWRALYECVLQRFPTKLTWHPKIENIHHLRRNGVGRWKKQTTGCENNRLSEEIISTLCCVELWEVLFASARHWTNTYQRAIE